MEEQRIETKLGRIALGIDGPIGEEPIVFLHGIFIDRTLWADVDRSLTGRAHIYTDMPAHGRSSDVGHTWSLDDGAEMLIEVLDALEVERCVAIGHSWGSMTALHAASRFPSRFVALGLFNMPFRRVEGLNRLGFRLQKSAAIFPRFYARQAAKSLYTAPFLRKRPELAEAMQARLARRPPAEIARIIDAVLLKATDATDLLARLETPALAVVGEADYVGVPPGIETRTVPGGHISPHEAPEETRQAIRRVVRLADRR